MESTTLCAFLFTFFSLYSVFVWFKLIYYFLVGFHVIRRDFLTKIFYGIPKDIVLLFVAVVTRTDQSKR